MFAAAKTKNVFKSKWNALFWSLSVMLTAYCSIPDAEDATDPAALEVVSETKAVTADADTASKWKKGPHYEVVHSEEAPQDDLQALVAASDKARAAIAKAR